ncbi:hypothetical protein ABRY23_10310 [Melioribacteraceae bacterium 4301-Me]|uniref:hypothetical protein n=1 Tax=Pyranulibacter aquaticus TaxID=3163344 RepID=UPI00359A5F97
MVFPKIVTRSWDYMGVELPAETSYRPSFAFSFMYNIKIDLGKKYFFNITPGVILGDKYYSGLLLGFNFQKYVYELWFLNFGFVGKIVLAQEGGHNYNDAEFFKPTVFFRLGNYVTKSIALNINYIIPLDNIYGKSYSHGYGYSNDVASTIYLRYMLSLGIEITR